MSSSEAKRGNEIPQGPQHAAARISAPSTREVAVAPPRGGAAQINHPAANAPPAGPLVRLNGHKVTCECERCITSPASPGGAPGAVSPPMAAPQAPPPATPEEKLAAERVRLAQGARAAAAGARGEDAPGPTPETEAVELAAVAEAARVPAAGSYHSGLADAPAPAPRDTEKPPAPAADPPPHKEPHSAAAKDRKR